MYESNIVTVRPVLSDDWPLLEQLFLLSSVTKGCWCMWPRTVRGEYRHGNPENKCRLKNLVRSNTSPGLIALRESEPVGWSAFGLISDFPQYGDIENNSDIWAIACLFVSAAGRGQGIARALVSTALEMARDGGATTVYGPPQWWSPELSQQTSHIARLLVQHGFKTIKSSGRVPLLRIDLPI